jgi:anti-sigma factor RsiW
MSLSRADLEARLMPYVDGELPREEAEAVARALHAHPDLAREAEALRALVETTRAAFGPTTSHAASVRFDGLADRVLARVGTPASRLAPHPVRPAAPSLGQRLAEWWRGFVAFERPFALAAAAAVVVAVLGTLALRDGERAPLGSGGGSFAKTETPPSSSFAPGSAATTAAGAARGGRRGPETEVAVGEGRGAVRIESAEVTDGRVFVEGGESEDKPLVLWHVVEGEGAAGAGAVGRGGAAAEGGL